MKILLINGSPKGKRSNSLKLAKSFIEGVVAAKKIKGVEPEIQELELSTLQVNPCKGCFACWSATPGVCCIKDDGQMILEKQIWADLIVWSFPLYYFNVPGVLKNMIDRQLPMNLPFMSSRTDGYGSGSHEARYDMSGKQHVLVSTCGFYSAEGNYDSVLRMFDHFLGVGNYTTIFCGQGELFRVKELSSRTDEYLQIVQRAGREFADSGIQEQTVRALQQLLYPKDVFESMADASWGVAKESGEKEPEDLTFTRQMAALYNRTAYDGKDRVLEMCYTDLGKTYQILLGKDGSKVFTDGSLTATTRIDTPYEVWTSIARGEIGGSEALAKQMYKVSGDFSLMIHWDSFFGSTDPSKGQETAAADKKKREKPPVMLAMLLPWVAFWSAVPTSLELGPVIALGITGLVPLLLRKHKIIHWDRISMASVAILAVITHVTASVEITMSAGYLVFGLMWLVSCFTKEPMCASYVKYNYGGDEALKNPIFMKTNYILAAGWGILYIAMAIWTWILQRVGVDSTALLFNNLAPAVMGLFTVWFERWYPAHVARGK